MRFAGGLSLSKYDFSGINVQGPSTGGDGGKMAAAWKSVRSNSPRYDSMEATGLATRANEKAAAMAADANVYATETAAEAEIESAKMIANAQKSAARSQAQGSMMGSIFGAIGSIGAGLLSDESTKTNIEPLEDALATLRELKPVTFYYNEEYSSSPERLHHGFIAQDYMKVLPDATYYDESIDKLCIDTGDLIAILVRAVQQLSSRVTRMEAANALKEIGVRV
jgi:hypothetical protein